MTCKLIMPTSDKNEEILEYLKDQLSLPENLTDLQINFDMHNPLTVKVTYYPECKDD